MSGGDACRMHALGEPLPRRRALALRAVAVAAGIVGDAFVRAVLAALDAERGGSTGLDRRHDLQLAEPDVAGVGLAPRRPMSANDVGDRTPSKASPSSLRVGRQEHFWALLAGPLQSGVKIAGRLTACSVTCRGSLTPS
jgi:hypothetical protein